MTEPNEQAEPEDAEMPEAAETDHPTGEQQAKANHENELAG
jgi:hypothetical protein